MEYIYLISSTTQVKAIDFKNAFEKKKTCKIYVNNLDKLRPLWTNIKLKICQS